MLKKNLFLVTFCLLFLLMGKPAMAVYDPQTLPNNKFGIHLGSAADLVDAARLVNSSGGDWGYVTFVIQKNQRDTHFWQTVFDQTRKLNLIPIVRVATQAASDGTWEKPSFDEIDGWVSFFNSLNWVIKNRYLIVGNEPNHAKEWAGHLNPEEYASYLAVFSQKLKKSSSDYFILAAGLDASAPNSKETMDEAEFLKRMLAAEPSLFTNLDGLSSHSYPNPNFSGSEKASGRGTLTTYNWELDLLRSLGVTKSLPVFITETGWQHTGGVSKDANLAPEELGPKFVFAFENVWSDKRVIAVTPFILSYPDGIFSNFSWQKKDGSFYPFYEEVAKIKKSSGKPEQETRGEVMAIFIPPLLGPNQSFWGIALAKNTGQSIWKNGELTLDIGKINLEIQIPIFGEIVPKKVGLLFFRGQTPQSQGFFVGSLSLARGEKVFTKPVHFSIMTLEKPNFWIILDQLRRIISLSPLLNGKIA